MPRANAPAISFLILVAAFLIAAPAHGAKGESQPKITPAKSLQALEALEPRALRLFPNSFGGLWLEGGKVYIAFTARGKRRVDRLGKRFPNPKRLRAITVDDSLAALRGIQARMIADRETNPVTATDPVSGRPLPFFYDLEIDVKRNLVMVIVERTVTQDLVTSFRGRYGEDVLVEQGALAKPVACTSRSSCAPDLRGGLEVSTSASAPGCSTAFNAHIIVALLILSAAHCGDGFYPDPEQADVGADRFHAGVQYGEVVLDQMSGRLDAEAHSVNLNAFSTASSFLYDDDANKSAKVTEIGTYDGLPVGSQLCKSGRTTGKDCGQVLSKTHAPDYVPGGMDFVRASFCAEPGDSGGAVYSHYLGKPKGKVKKGKKPRSNPRYRAHGILSGSATNLCGDPADFSTFGHIEFVLDTFPINLTISP